MVSIDGTITGFWRLSDFFGDRGVDISIPSQIDGVEIRAIGSFAFQNNRLRSVVIPDSVTVIKHNAFANNQLTSLMIPENITSIGRMAFARNQLTSVTIPDSITTIGEGIFMDNQLTSIVIPENVISIGALAFYNNQLESITIPSSVRSIGGGAFAMNELRSLTIGSDVEFARVFVDPWTVYYPFSGNFWVDDDFNPVLVHFYNTNRRMAGTYVFTDDGWSMK
ncbi:MAG: leucine-rich repeat domain-containing protein [Treponema sp.]|nr:leucine-rich repeat domain-containing protein [Treponema sp.]